jgi:hypothetical protein
VTKEALIEKIESLPPEKRARVEELVDSLCTEADVTATAPARSSESLAERLRATRERLLRERGLFDSLPHIRQFRETGGR